VVEAKAAEPEEEKVGVEEVPGRRIAAVEPRPVRARGQVRAAGTALPAAMRASEVLP